MSKKVKTNYSQRISIRIMTIMKFSGLEIAGLAEFVNVSESHLYSIINNKRRLTAETANKIAQGFNLKGSQILDLNYKIPREIQKSSLLLKFYEENKTVPGFFQVTRIDRKKSLIVESILLLDKQLFKKPVTVSEVRIACEEAGKKYSSKQVSQILNYLVDINKLKKQKKPIQLKSGNLGLRRVDVFFKYDSKD